MNKRDIGNKFTAMVCDLLYNKPLEWKFTRYEATYEDLQIWVANAKYADM